MRVRSVILLSLAILIIASIGVSWVVQPIDDLWVENPFWNGLSDVQTILKPVRLSGLENAELLSSNSTILMLGPSLAYSETEITSMRSYLEDGGRIVLTDDFGTGNSLVAGLGLNVRFSGQLLRDELFKERKMMPRIFLVEASPETIGVKELVFNYPTVLTGVKADEALAYASFFSEVSNSTGVGPFPVMALLKMGKGSIILISDSSIFINGMLDQGDNLILLKNLQRGALFIDEAHSAQSRLAQFRNFSAAAYGLFNHPEIKYSLAAVLIVGVFKVRWEDMDEQPDEVEETLRRRPEWSRRELEELREARRRAHGEN